MDFGVTIHEDDLLYSTIFGGGIYKETGNWSAGVYGEKDGNTPVLSNVLTGELFFARRFRDTALNQIHYTDLIKQPMPREGILWPIDMISVQDEDNWVSFVEAQYKEKPIPNTERHGKLALLFPYRESGKWLSLEEKWRGLRDRNWKNTQIQDMVVKMIHAIDAVNKQGFVYQDIHMSRFLFDESQNVLLDFSNLIYSFSEMTEAGFVGPAEDEYPLEFADPYFVRGDGKTMDFDSQNFSICAMLFYLLIGRYPYDGRLMDGFNDDDDLSHYTKFRTYHKKSIFIFDPEDDRNSIGLFSDEEEYIRLWNDLPGAVKLLFVKTLREDNAGRKDSVSNATMKEWIACLREVGWDQQG